ncbi:hypothetical protein K505DRAFT_116578 [Melanomma pulvis-pyrius CBS 109.77]|uniref:Uncharacterized protein n=1 Tax=Melanomma pulvis-pyrius CBS 109.77 TaxID=1314802 RepID=A0A6A6XQ14_9PLEO|nr:hypothetical protein K505DRAFT_116578 [Melanomma pulvis-pyrius CBS 109.77]
MIFRKSYCQVSLLQLLSLRRHAMLLTGPRLQPTLHARTQILFGYCILCYARWGVALLFKCMGRSRRLRKPWCRSFKQIWSKRERPSNSSTCFR